MRILVTGAGGFTGRHFMQAARAAGHAPVALQSNLTQPDALRAEVLSLQPEAVVHLAAISFVAHADERAFYDVNLFGTLNLLDALKAQGALRKVLLASSANVYGNSARSPLSEEQPPAPVNHYAVSKLSMELMAAAAGEGLPIVFSRPFNYTGPGQDAQFVIPKLVDHFRRKAPSVRLGNVDVQREYNDVRFLCEAYLRLLQMPTPGGTFNVCSGTTYSIRNVLDVLESLTGHDMRVEFDPSLVRTNEVLRLCGDPTRLTQAVGALPAYQLKDTLSWMLSTPA